MSRTALSAATPSRRPSEAIEALDRLAKWAGAALGSDIGISFQPPVAVPLGQRLVDLHALALTAHPTARDRRASQVRFDLRVLVTAWAPDPLDAHQDLCDLAFAATDAPLFQLDLDALADLPWAALGIGPRPALLLRVPLQRQWTLSPVPHVREPLVVSTTSVMPR
jgi:hypothetical protein